VNIHISKVYSQKDWIDHDVVALFVGGLKNSYEGASKRKFALRQDFTYSTVAI